jgi:hypothetical protein
MTGRGVPAADSGVAVVVVAVVDDVVAAPALLVSMRGGEFTGRG